MLNRLIVDQGHAKHVCCIERTWGKSDFNLNTFTLNKKYI